MRRQNKRFWAAVKYSASLLGCLIVSLLSSCRSISGDGSPAISLPLKYSIVFIIHGDGEYSYHDRNGNTFRADEKTFTEATAVAIQNPEAEVFIFHEKPATRLLVFFPQPDGEFCYYRNGILVTNESYWRDQRDFETEAALYHRSRAPDQQHGIKLFFYFGHEIPEAGGEGYSASYPDRSFTIDDLTRVFSHLTGDSTTFDLVVLSTCFNGTPYTVASLSPYARYVIASPDNLHLSYFDLAPLQQLDLGRKQEEVGDFARKFAQNAFDRLTPDIQTAITVAVYDVERVQGFLRSVRGAYTETLASLQIEHGVESAAHCDCAEDSAYIVPGMSEGVYILYRPSRFGRAKNKLSHSGWECRAKKMVQDGARSN